MLTAHDIYLFKEGTHGNLYEKLGAQVIVQEKNKGVHFAVWAPNAEKVSVIGDFNGWDPQAYFLSPRLDSSGIWEGFIPNITPGALYKYHIQSRFHHYCVNKSDPFAFHCETPPRTASIVWDLSYDWQDHAWMQQRKKHNALDAPWSVYEAHLGSWRRIPEQGNRFLTYRELAPLLAEYAVNMGFTHVELLPVMEHPFYGSWGYQVTGFFAPTSRYGTPQDFMFLIDTLHQHNIGIILDWVPSHFPADEHGLAYFDGSYLYEHADPKKGFHPEWGSSIFNYGRHEVRAFLLSNALFWLKKYHIDGLRVDAVASMLYLDYGRKEGEWIPNSFGGKENLEAVHFLKTLNESVYGNHPDVQMIAEESTAWPQVSRPVYLGGLGFGMKWNMGWMHDTLKYYSHDPVYRKHYHNELTFSIWYAFYENFMLPLSHDEVVYGKGSLVNKMPGDEWQQFANLRLLYGYMWTHPGKKLLFMGGEFAQRREWTHESSLEWQVLRYSNHQGIQHWIRDLNRIYRSEPALHEQDFSDAGFEWIDPHDWEQSVISFLRKSKPRENHEVEQIVVICNATPVLRQNYVIGVPSGGYWKELLNSDALIYGGSGQGNLGGVQASSSPAHGRNFSLCITLPPLAVVVFKKI